MNISLDMSFGGIESAHYGVTTTRTLVTAALILGFVSLASGQGRGPGTTSSHLRRVTPLLSSQGLTVRLNLPEASQWTIGIGLARGLPELFFADGVLRDDPVPHFSSLVDLSGDQVRVSQGLVEVTPSQKLKGKLLGYLAVPAGARVAIRTGGSIAFDGQIRDSRGLLVANGSVVAAECRQFRDVLRFEQSGLVPTKDMAGTSTGRFVVSSKLMSDHLTVWVQPDLRPTRDRPTDQ